jgi:hypothetical protein
VYVPDASVSVICEVVLPWWSSFSCSAVPEVASPRRRYRWALAALDSSLTVTSEDASRVKV